MGVNFINKSLETIVEYNRVIITFVENELKKILRK